MVEIMVIASIWESMAAWFTPTVLFCVTNLIIATIFIASGSNNHHVHAHGDSTSLTPLARVSSFLDRARSMNLSSSQTTAESHHQYTPQSKPQPTKTANYSSSSRLAQSIYLSSNYASPTELPESTENSVSQPARVTSFKSDAPGELVRVPSFMDRVKSFKICSAFRSTEPVTVDDNAEHHVIRSKSEKTPVKKTLAEMKKSRSEVRMETDEEEDVDMRRPATTRERRSEFEEEVDAKADDFISRFKQQLKLQRLESLVRYNEMLNRGR